MRLPMRKLIILISLLLPAPAVADELPALWTGVYFGFHGGASDWTLGRPDDTSSPTQKIKGGFGGGQLGYNYQFPFGLVLGAEADISFGDQSSGRYQDGSPYMVVNSDIDIFGTVRGRVGWAVGRFMPYVTGGLAWMEGDLSEECIVGNEYGHCRPVKAGGAGPYQETGKMSEVGYVYGGGLEVMITQNITLRGEYLHLDFGTSMHDLGPKSWDREEKINADIVRGAVNYKF
jgi:outer membrane immunogenic protein